MKLTKKLIAETYEALSPACTKTEYVNQIVVKADENLQTMLDAEYASMSDVEFANIDHNAPDYAKRTDHARKVCAAINAIKAWRKN